MSGPRSATLAAGLILAGFVIAVLALLVALN